MIENHPAYKYSIRILSKRDYSRAKLKQKLLDREHGDIADELIDFLVDKKYLREDLYVEGRIKGMMKKNYAPSYIVLKLNEEQVSVNYPDVMEVFNEWKFTTFSQIEELIRKKSNLHNWSPEDIKEPKNNIKLTRYIQTKGHSWDDIKEFF